MNKQLKRYLPIALCCVPGLIIALVISTGVSLGDLLKILPTGIAVLACPIAMVIMMVMMNRQDKSEKNQTTAPASVLKEDLSRSEV